MSTKVLLAWLSMGLIRGMIWFNLDCRVHITLSCSVDNSCTVPHLVYTVVIGISQTMSLAW